MLCNQFNIDAQRRRYKRRKNIRERWSDWERKEFKELNNCGTQYEKLVGCAVRCWRVRGVRKLGEETNVYN